MILFLCTFPSFYYYFGLGGGIETLFWDAFLGAGEENLREKLVLSGLVWLSFSGFYSFMFHVFFSYYYFFGYMS